jgi:hypothetical protein
MLLVPYRKHVSIIDAWQLTLFMEKSVYSENHIQHVNTVPSKCTVFLFNTKGAGVCTCHSALKGQHSKGKVYGRENAVWEPVEGGDKLR